MSNVLSFFLQLTICSLLARFSLFMFSAFIPKSMRVKIANWVDQLCNYTLQGMEDFVTTLFGSKEKSEEVKEVVATKDDTVLETVLLDKE